ncbi:MULTISPECIES: RodZ family helix-turn-helix domain-containing protein [Thiorhodovibrio]|uniref:hypothetical protein n=1 Tax=Thiorhodovibrio TaxID=61593 RepID=UPI001911B3A2|nr:MULTISPECIES: hypothetical protein [Thiorhodovibrio]MBK5968100.1 hypothetical protein [Thiorhodovibrio winogradskyi]WPL12690.1 Tfp pilus assembly protein, major pilin PilA [Thiorhodovibrio litoralis]
MAEPTFDVLFSGELIGSADPEHVKQRLAQMFKLDEAGAARLFGGHRVFIKRGVDQATADRFREVFAKAGALAEIEQVGGEPEEVFHFDDSDDEADTPAQAPVQNQTAQNTLGQHQADQNQSAEHQSAEHQAAQHQSAQPSAAGDAAGSWSVAPAGSELEELSDSAPEQNPDTSQLSLVEGNDWTLEDCAPPPLAQAIPDIDSMELEPSSKSDSAASS